MLKINGVELEFDFLDADTMEAYETAFEAYQEGLNKWQDEANLKESEKIRKLCHLVFDVFNDIFGEGTDKDIFGDKTSLTQCMDALELLIEEAQRQRSVLESRKQKHSHNREQRRARR